MSDEKQQNEVIAVREPTPMTLLEKAISANMDVEKLEKLMALQERYKAGQALEAFTTAMNACQRDLPVVVKDANNAHTRSRYALLETILHTIKPTITKNGFSLSFSEGETTKENCMRVVAKVRHISGHTEESHLDIPLDGKGAKGGSVMTETHGKSSTFSYGKRYLTCAIFNVVVAGEDLDGNRVEDQEPISDEQSKTIEDLIGLCEDLGGKTVRAKFMAWIECEKLEEIPASRFKDCTQSLNQTRINLEKKAKGE